MPKVPQQNYLTTPLIEYKGELTPALSKSDLLALLEELELAIKKNEENLNKFNIIYWLTYALHCAVEMMDANLATMTAGLMIKLTNMQSIDMHSLLEQKFVVGKFTGQNTMFAWMNELYSATFDIKTFPTIVAINQVFTHWFLLPNREKIASMLIEQVDEGLDKGKNALLLLAQALSSAVKDSSQQESAAIIVDLLTNCVKIIACCEKTSTALHQEVSRGSFAGKSVINVLVSLLKDAAKNNPLVVRVVCDILTTSSQNISLRDKQITALSKLVGIGESAGLNSLQILITALVSSAYIDHNDEIIKILATTLKKLVVANHEKVIPLFTAPISSGQYVSQTGISLLLQAHVAASKHGSNSDPIAELLSFIKFSAGSGNAMQCHQRMFASRKSSSASDVLSIVKSPRSPRSPRHLEAAKAKLGSSLTDVTQCPAKPPRR